jgi:hypothetical protein
LDGWLILLASDALWDSVDADGYNPFNMWLCFGFIQHRATQKPLLGHRLAIISLSITNVGVMSPRADGRLGSGSFEVNFGDSKRRLKKASKRGSQMAYRVISRSTDPCMKLNFTVSSIDSNELAM